ncbi:hypothetical protein [Neptunomonas qingdaonensis]|uniref:hypothetical protein n=1 Tax=Neptunomonas qingdaonensis TaxID=1045558 RepID=UPI0015A502A9|nr:hypothetical protein [Neptunomonas qingdaonensis]
MKVTRTNKVRITHAHLPNSGKHIAPVIELVGKPVGDGSIGPIWEKASDLQ